MKHLINRLESEPHIEKVWFNESGGWSLNPDPKHLIERSKEEVLEHWDSLSDAEKAELSGELPPVITEEENDVYETLKLLEEENELLKEEHSRLEVVHANQTEELEQVKKAQHEQSQQAGRYQAELAEANKTIVSLQKKLKKEEKTPE